MDTVSKEKRSEMMSKIRSKGNSSTELRLIALFREYGITGWRRNSTLTGHPDFVFPSCRLAVFVDGCFWHGCKLCTKNRLPKSNRKFWRAKIERNIKRDREVTKQLSSAGYKVVRIRECMLKKSPKPQIKRILNRLECEGSI